MSDIDKSIVDVRRAAASTALAALFAVVMAAMAAAQETQPLPREEGFFSAAGRWFEEQAAKLGSGFKDARRGLEHFGQEAGAAAKTTADGAKDAADAVVRIPHTRPVTGHETCRIAPNGAPDCIAAADALCKRQGFTYGKSLDMTTAEVCPPKVYMSGRAAAGECRTETFVSRALCQ
jgi:hypothetical protein